MRRICVFCGSNAGRRPAYSAAARRLGQLLAEQRLGLVYGGGKVGLMGAVADAALAAGGQVIGVIPRMLMDLEVGHRGLTTLHVVGSMHERKALMEELSDGFIALPGGFGTFEEFCEILTWAQLGIHRKPCALVNIEGYYDPLIALFDRAVEEGLLKENNRRLVIAGEDADSVLDRLLTMAVPPQAEAKWITPGQV